MSGKGWAIRILVSGLLCSTTLGWRGAAKAADDAAAATEGTTQSGGLEEIVVTARKRTELLQNVPVAVSVVTQTQLRNNDATDLMKITELMPDVFAGQASTGTGAILSIRGIGSSPLDAGIDQSVSVEVDSVQLSRGRIITEAMYDLRQVEVLEGPQALFFGKNSPAGVISIRSADPTDSFEGYIRGGYETEAAEKFGEGAISGPITDNLTARLAFRASGMDGWTKNVATPVPYPNLLGIPFPNNNAPVFTPGAQDPTTPMGENFGFRLSVHWTPTDDFDAMLKVSGNYESFNGGQAYNETYCTHGQPLTIFGAFVATQDDCTKNQVVAVSALPAIFAKNYPNGHNGDDYFDSKNILTSLVLNQNFDKFTVTSTTGYYRQLVSDAGTYDTSEFALIWDPEKEDYTLISQELRATTSWDFPVNFTGGFYFDHFDRPHYNAPFLMWEGINSATGNAANNEQQIENDGNTYSIFAQMRWAITPDLELAGGARWTHEEKNTSITQIAVNPIGNFIVGPFHPVGSVLSGHYSDYNMSPEATLTWHPAEGQTLYAAYKTGYKSGGIANTAVIHENQGINDLTFKHESSYGEEIGYKVETLNHTLRFDLTAYRYKYNNLQVSVFDPQTISYLLKNAASARTQGLEGHATWAAAPGLTLTAAASYNQARFLAFPGGQCYAAQTAALGCINGEQDLKGKPLLHAPDVTFDIGADYIMDVGNWTLNLAADAAYTSSYIVNETEDPAQVQDAYWKLNASVKLSPTDGNYTLSLIGKNLTNSYYMIYSSGDAGAGPYNFAGYFNRPREIILQGEYKF